MSKSKGGFLKTLSRIFEAQRLLLALAVLVSGLMTSTFMASLAPGRFEQILLGAFGIVLELTKVWAWDRAAQHRQKPLIALAVLISFLSILGSLAFSSLSFISGSEIEQQRDTVRQRLESLAATTRDERSELERNLKLLDPRSVTLRLRLQDKIDALSAQELSLIERLADTAEAASGTPIRNGTSALGGETTLLMTLGFLIIALIVEMAIGVVTFESRRDKQSSKGATDLIVAFIKLAPWIDATGRVVARSEVLRSDLPEREWRAAVSLLASQGVLTRRQSDRSYELEAALRQIAKTVARPR